MPGAEKWLAPELVEAVKGKKNPRDASMHVDDHVNLGSDNWPPMAAGIEWVCRRDNDEWWLDEMESQESAYFQRKESLSRIYSEWAVVPVIAVWNLAEMRGRKVLAAALRPWLRTWWTAVTLGSGGSAAAPVGTFTGPRSWAVARDADGNRKGDPHHIHNHVMDSLHRCSLDLANAVTGGDGKFSKPIVEELKRLRGGVKACEVMGLTADERSALRGALNGDLSRWGEINAWLQAFRPRSKRIIVRTTTGDAATWLPNHTGGVSTKTLECLIARGSKLEPLASLDPKRGGDTSAHAKYEVGDTQFRAYAVPDGPAKTAPGLSGSEIWRVSWGGSEAPPPVPPPIPPGQEPPPPDSFMDPILVHAYATVDLPETGDSTATAIQRAKNKAKQIEAVRLKSVTLPGDPILIHARATMALPEPGDNEATTLQRARNKAGQIILVREAERR